MRSILVIGTAAIIVAGFLVYMSSYTVSFTQSAVITTFGKVPDSGAVQDEGLHFKWPTPIQNVTLYDTRARFLQTESETQQTADDRQLIIESFLTWRISDPVMFYERFRSGSSVREHYAQAESQLISLLRSAMSEASNYRMTDLFAAGAGRSQLGDLEASILARMRDDGAGSGNVASLGIELLLVGINSIVLPEDTTKQVFERMTEGRRRLAAQAESEGEALAMAIRSDAENSAARIREFAQLRANQIRARGDMEASQYLTTLNEDPELANFLAFIDLLRGGFGERVTMVLPTSLPGLTLLSMQAAEQIQRGELPGFGLSTPHVSPARDAADRDAGEPQAQADAPRETP